MGKMLTVKSNQTRKVEKETRDLEDDKNNLELETNYLVGNISNLEKENQDLIKSLQSRISDEIKSTTDQIKSSDNEKDQCVTKDIPLLNDRIKNLQSDISNENQSIMTSRSSNSNLQATADQASELEQKINELETANADMNQKIKKLRISNLKEDTKDFIILMISGTFFSFIISLILISTICRHIRKSRQNIAEPEMERENKEDNVYDA